MNENNHHHKSESQSAKQLPKRILLNKLNPNIELVNFKMKKVMQQRKEGKITYSPKQKNNGAITGAKQVKKFYYVGDILKA